MKWRVEFSRRTTTKKASQVGMKYAVEVTAKDEPTARAAAIAEAQRVGKALPYQITNVRKI